MSSDWKRSNVHVDSPCKWSTLHVKVWRLNVCSVSQEEGAYPFIHICKGRYPTSKYWDLGKSACSITFVLTRHTLLPRAVRTHTKPLLTCLFLGYRNFKQCRCSNPVYTTRTPCGTCIAMTRAPYRSQQDQFAVSIFTWPGNLLLGGSAQYQITKTVNHRHTGFWVYMYYRSTQVALAACWHFVNALHSASVHVEGPLK